MSTTVNLSMVVKKEYNKIKEKNKKYIYLQNKEKIPFSHP
jgi:hypothetical protein